MLPFRTSLLRLSFLMPLEIARAYAEAFLPTASISTPRPPPKADRVPSDQPTNPAKTMSTQFYDTQVATVDYQILFTKRNLEAILDSGRVIVTSAMAGSGFTSWQISLFIQKLNAGIPKPEDWTDDEATELAKKVVPTSYPAAPDPAAAAAVVAAAEASAAAAKDAAEHPGDVTRALAAWVAADTAKVAADEPKAAAPAALKEALRVALVSAVQSRDAARTYERDKTDVNYLAAAKAVRKAADDAATADDYYHPCKTVIGLKPENLKYLQVDYQVINTFDRKPPRYEADQVDALREIATVIKNKP